MADKQVRVTQVRSSIASKPKAKGTLRALGLGRIGKTHVLPDTRDVRGMINRVPHLIKVEELQEGQDS
jgi:large subunit ribosomal protein L30